MQRQLVFLVLSILLFVLLLVACGAGKNPAEPSDDDTADDAGPLDDDESATDDDGDDIENHRGTLIDVEARLAVNSADDMADARIFAARDGAWVEQPTDGSMSGALFSQDSPDYGSGVTADAESLAIIIRFDGTIWAPETVPAGVENGFWFPTALANGSSYAVGSTHTDDTSLVIWDMIIARGNDGAWSAETLPAISEPALQPIWLVDADGVLRVSGNDLASGMAFVLRRDASGWVEDELPAVSSSWWISPYWDVVTPAPGEGIWLYANDLENKRGVILSLQDGVWTSLTLPAVSANWALRGLAVCPDGSAYAMASDYENDHAVALAYGDGNWNVESLPGLSPAENESEERFYVRVVCGPDSVPWVAASVDAYSSFSVVSKRSGSWAVEELPNNGQVGYVENVLYNVAGRPTVLGVYYNDGKDLFSVGWSYTLTDGQWVEADLSFIDLENFWAFRNSVATADGTILVIAYSRLGNHGHILQWDGNEWKIVDPPIVGDFGVSDLRVY